MGETTWAMKIYFRFTNTKINESDYHNMNNSKREYN